jgi:hypothetical protein
VLKNNEIRQYGEYRTARRVLEAWDRLHTQLVGMQGERSALHGIGRGDAQQV